MADKAIADSLSAAVNEYMQWWDTRQHAAGNAERVVYPLYHYTDGTGLAGIIGNQEFWLTSIFQLNDTGELDFGVRFAMRELTRQAERGDPVLKYMIDRMKEVLDGEIHKEFDFFVGSLTRRGNNLGQWGFYGDDGKGFALGVTPATIHGVDALVAEVAYGRGTATARQGEAIEKAVAIVNANLKHIYADPKLGSDFLKGLSVQLAISILWNSITIKDSAYRPEAEVRLIVPRRARNLADVRIRLRGTEKIRYIGLTVPFRDRKNFRRLVMGPDAPPDAENAVAGFLTAHGIDSKGLLYRSRIPYRSRLPAEPVHHHFEVAK
ncbi:MAG: hypothetical protein WDO56_33795 [Gammaproteobacteria bacterium]